MFMYLALFIFLILGARLNSAYNPHLIFKKYVVIKNGVWSKILISQSDAISKNRNAKSNRNKLPVFGIVFYGLSILLLASAAIIIYAIPAVSIKPYVIDTRYLYLYISTLNEKIVITVSFLLMFVEFTFYLVNTSKYAFEKTTHKKFSYALYIIFATLFSFGALYEIWDLITCF